MEVDEPVDVIDVEAETLTNTENSNSVALNATQSDESTSCPVCLESWSSSGAHRLVSLKCGHLFGQLCIERWLSSGSKCPQCNAKANKKEIRPIYAKYVTAVDTQERDDAIRLLEVEKIKRSKSEQSHLKISMQCQMLVTENTHLRKRLKELEAQLTVFKDPSYSKLMNGGKLGCYMFVRSMLVSAEKHARAITSDPSTGLIAISKHLEESVASGYGVLKVSSIESTRHEFVPLHTHAVKDICFSPHANSVLLSCSKNKELKLTDLKSNTCAQKYKIDGEGWSCNWSGTTNNVVYCGIQNGTVHVFDIRNTRGPITNLSGGAVTGGVSQRCPVISVISVPYSQTTVPGMLVSTLQGITFWTPERSGGCGYEPSFLGVSPGALSSVCLEPNSGTILASYRPGMKCPTERHIVSTLTTSMDKPPSLHKQSEFHGAASQCLRAKSCLIKAPGKGTDLMVCAGNQVTNVVNVWSTEKSECIQSWNIRKEDGPILSVVPHRADGSDFLCVLTDQKMFQYKWLSPGDSTMPMVC